MRTRTGSPVLLAVAALTLPLAAGAVAVPTASAQASPDACTQALNPDRRSVYRFKSGAKTLGFGRVIVTATKANPHRYCHRIDFDGRKVFHAFGESGYERRNGAWVNVGGLGDSGYEATSYTRTVQVPDHYRIDRTYSIRSGGRWYRTISISRYNL